MYITQFARLTNIGPPSHTHMRNFAMQVSLRSAIKSRYHIQAHASAHAERTLEDTTRYAHNHIQSHAWPKYVPHGKQQLQSVENPANKSGANASVQPGIENITKRTSTKKFAKV